MRSARGRSVVAQLWPGGRSRGEPGPHDRRLSTEPWESSWLRVNGSLWYSPSRSAVGRSSRSTRSLIPRASAGLTWFSSATDVQPPLAGNDDSRVRLGRLLTWQLSSCTHSPEQAASAYQLTEPHLDL